MMDTWPLRTSVVVLLMALLVGCSGQDSSPPEPSPTVQSEADDSYAVTISRCLVDLGWTDLDYNERDGSITFDGPPAQQAQLDEDFATCEGQFGAEPRPFSSFTDEEWAALYDQDLAAAECLRDEGFNIPEAPSRETYIERYQGDDPWLAYLFIGNVPADELYALYDKCPQPELLPQ